VIWTGAVNNAWGNPANWDCGALPDANTEVVIFQKTNNPEVNANTSCYSITLQSPVLLTIKPGVALTITGLPGN
jgi:hypothetical protein